VVAKQERLEAWGLHRRGARPEETDQRPRTDGPRDDGGDRVAAMIAAPVRISRHPPVLDVRGSAFDVRLRRPPRERRVGGGFGFERGQGILERFGQEAAAYFGKGQKASLRLRRDLKVELDGSAGRPEAPPILIGSDALFFGPWRWFSAHQCDTPLDNGLRRSTRALLPVR
jgi:hypothetical protein